MNRFKLSKLIFLFSLLCTSPAFSQRIRLLDTRDSIQLAHRIDSIKNDINSGFNVSAARDITNNDILHWDQAFSWGQPDLSNYVINTTLEDYLLKSDSATYNTKYRADTSISNIYNSLANKVDKITGKGLSSNDYTAIEKTKLSGIESGATANNTDAFLLNRTNHTGTQAATTIVQDATHRFTTDVEKSVWNGKQDALGFVPYNANNPNGFITSSALLPYALQSDLSTTNANVNNNTTAITGKQNTIITGSPTQYFRGDLSLATFPTSNSSFSNGAGYAIAANNFSDIPNVSTAKTNLGLAVIASSGSASDLINGTLPAARTAALTGDVTKAAGNNITTVSNISNATLLSLGIPKIIGQSNVQTSLTGSITETTLYTLIIPAGSVGANSSLRFMWAWTATNSANNKTFRIKVNGTTVASDLQTTNTTMQRITILRNRNSLSSEFIMGSIGGTSNIGFAASSNAINTFAFDFSADVTITVTGQLANSTETMALEGISVVRE